MTTWPANPHPSPLPECRESEKLREPHPIRRIARRFGPALLLALVTLLVFSPVLRNQFVPFWDDEDKVLGNPDYHPARLANLAHYWVPPPHQTFFVPVTYGVYGLLAMAAGFNPVVFHAANLVAHILSAVLVFVILKRLVRSARAAWLGAALFALHPLQVDPVAWIGTLYTPLSGMFALFAIWQYLLFAEGAAPPRSTGAADRFRWLHYALGTLAFVLALLAKPSTVVVPVMLLAIEHGLYRRRIRDLVVPLGIWAALCVPIVLINRLAYPGTTIYAPVPWQRVVVALDTIAFYLYKLVLPIRLVPDYGRSPRWVVGHPVVWLTCAVPIAVYIICRICRRRLPWLGVCAAIFVAGLIPVLGLTPFDFQIYSTPADRYVSLSLLGVATAAAFVLARYSGKLATSVAVLCLCLLALRSFDQTSMWHDQWRLFATTLEVNPDSRAAAAAFRYLFVDQKPEADATCTLSGPELVKVGDLLLRQRRSDLAVDAYELAISRSQGNAETYRKLATALSQNGQQHEADNAAREAARLESAGDHLSR